MTLTKDDLKDALSDQRKEINKNIETAIAHVINAVIEHTASKEDLKRVEGRLGDIENRLEKVETDVSHIKRSINDLKADVPTPQDFANHEKRIGKLETAVFPS